MSKKQILNRLENLFLGLAGAENVSPDQPAAEKDTRKVEFLNSDSVSGWSWQTDRDGRYTSCSEGVIQWLKTTPKEVIGKSILDSGLNEEGRSALTLALAGDRFPVEIDAAYHRGTEQEIAVRIHVLGRAESSSTFTGWHGFTQGLDRRLLSEITSNEEPSSALTGDIHTRENGEANQTNRSAGKSPTSKDRLPDKSHGTVSGYASVGGRLEPAGEVWTKTGWNSLTSSQVVETQASANEPAALAVPVKAQEMGNFLLEIVDDSSDRIWTEDDLQLVKEVAGQLALALDNAQLYVSVQQELNERIRAEQAILRRNKDLAALNQIGQQLTRLSTRSEIYNMLSEMIAQVLDNSNLFICALRPKEEVISFPVYRKDGQPAAMPDQPLQNGIPEYVIRTQEQLLVNQSMEAELLERGIALPERLPASLLAIPLTAGGRVLGAVVVQDFSNEGAFDSIHAELLSTAAAQATTAIENADLFEQMQVALEAIENRERYQSNVARAAAILTEHGTRSMSDVLKTLGQAAQCSRVYFAKAQEDAQGPYWSATADWMEPSIAYLFDKTRLAHLPVSSFSNWAQELKEKGWTTTTATQKTSSEADLLNQQHLRSTLLLAVPEPTGVPSFVAFDELSSERVWLNEEVNALRVAADAISNTFVREGLLDQVQITLDETEGLYQASNRLALANDMQEMVTAVLSATRPADINRSVLLLFDQDQYGKITRIVVGASWYNGRGTPPPPVGSEYPRAQYERYLQTAAPLFYEDAGESGLDLEFRQVLASSRVRGLAILPLWSGKRQTGALLLLSETRHRFTAREMRTYPPLVDQMATAVENQRLFEQTQKALSETGLLYNVSNRISQASGAYDILAMIVDTVLPAPAENAALLLIESDEQGNLSDLEMVGMHNRYGSYSPLGTRLPVSALPLVRTVTDEAIILNDLSSEQIDPASRDTLEQFGIGACCIVPLRSSGRLTGLLFASSNQAAEFKPNDTHLLRIVGSGIAVAMEKQRLLRQAQRRALELQTASEIARDTASTLSLDLLLSRIVNMLSERFTFTHTAIFLLDETGSYAVVREATGQAGNEMKEARYRLAVGSDSVVGRVLQTGESYISNDAPNDPLHHTHPLLTDTQSEMGIPLKIGTNIIGALDLHAGETGAFDQDDVTVLQILADQIAIAIENARAYELSQRAIEDMKEIDRVKSQFLANMSHELRTPLNSIIGFSRLIIKGIDGPINETQATDLNAIYNAGQHLLSLINDILDLSKIEAGKMELALNEVHLVDLINSAMSTAVGLVKDKPIRLNTNVPDDLPSVRADNTRVRQVLINLLSNAAKFTDEGNITVEAYCTASSSGQPEVMVTVTDSGPGIAPADQVKLFLPFSQVDDSPTRKTGGTGLGLSICRSLIDMHGGRIGLLRSEVGCGSTFFFTLPVYHSTPGLEADYPGASSRIILAVDDDARVISLYERYLKAHGFQVIALTDPKLAVIRAKEIRPFAITLDIMMPELDGWQVMRMLKNDPETRDIPIVVCSILENQEKGFSMGAADYLVKPFLQEDLINAVNRLNFSKKIKEVLVIDDDPADLRLVQKMLEENSRFQVATAEGGTQGWEIMQTKQPDAVILDLFMPDMNGFTVLENMRTHLSLRHVPVIVLTGADLSPEQHQQLNQFGQEVLAKGYLREKDLLILLEEALRKLSHQTLQR